MLKLAAALAAFAFPAAVSAQNLVANGDFEAGFVGFATNYVYAPAANTSAQELTVRTNPFPWNPNFVSIGDHTTGTGNMLVVNGATTPGVVVYQTPLAIASNTAYNFEAFVANIAGGGVPTVTFSVSLDGGALQLLDTLTLPGSPLGTFFRMSANFNTGSATTASLFLVADSLDGSGNDFAVDDIFVGAAVPEPGSWALMVGGFGLAGAAMRRKQPARALA